MRSTGIVEETFTIKHHKLRVFDVGGQRSERKKWIHAFEAVDQLVFVVAISEYDQALYEDETVNRLSEAKMLFESLSSSRWFERSSFVLLSVTSLSEFVSEDDDLTILLHRLNKIDIFEQKLKSNSSPLKHHFPDYTGGSQDFPAACAFMKSKFIALNAKPDRPLYVVSRFSSLNRYLSTDSNSLFQHLTCATDTGQVKVVIAAVMDTVLNKLLSEVGLM